MPRPANRRESARSPSPGKRASYELLPTEDIFVGEPALIDEEEEAAENTDAKAPFYRPELDFDNDGKVDDFEIRFGELLDRARAGRTVELGADVWGCAIYTIVVDLPVLMYGGVSLENVMRFASVVFVLALNLTLQIGLLVWITRYVMLPSIKATQDTYAMFHSQVYSTDGVFEPWQFESFTHAESLCQFPLFDDMFTFAVLFLWATQCFVEIRISQRIFTGLRSLPTLPDQISYKQMVSSHLEDANTCTMIKACNASYLELTQAERNSNEVRTITEILKTLVDYVTETQAQAHNERRHLVCLTPVTRLVLYAFVLVPRMVIIFVLMLLGSIWLLATTRFDSLILNALALEFIVEVDNLLFTMFFPVSLHEEVDSLKVAVPAEQLQGAPATKRVSALSGEGKELDKAKGYFRSMGYLAAVVLFVVTFRRFQVVLPGYNSDLGEACTDYIGHWSTPRYSLGDIGQILRCVVGRDNCFPYGISE